MMADDAINLKVTSPCWNVIKSNWKLPGSSEQPGGFFIFYFFRWMAVRAVKTLNTFPQPTVANVTLNPHQSESSPLALLPPSSDQNPIQAIPHSHSPTLRVRTY